MRSGCPCQSAGIRIRRAVGRYHGLERRHDFEDDRTFGAYQNAVQALSLTQTASTSLDNLVLHLDWNQASIDTERVCREGNQPGDYVQWDPVELAYLNDWNVIYVPGGFDFRQVLAARARGLTDPQRLIDASHTDVMAHELHLGAEGLLALLDGLLQLALGLLGLVQRSRDDRLKDAYVLALGVLLSQPLELRR